MERQKRARIDDVGRSSREVTAKAQPTRACAECKKHKIRCEVLPGEAACQKCQRSGITCMPYNFAQKFIDADTVWKAQASAQIERLEATVKTLIARDRLPEHTIGASDQVSPQTVSNSISMSTALSPGQLAGSPPTSNDDAFVPAPMSNLYNLTEARKDRTEPASITADCIDSGIIDLQEAEFLHEYYKSNINALLWAGILCPYETLLEIRQASQLLLTAVLTVAAFHSPGRRQSLNAAYGEFVALAEKASISQRKNQDDIRGLCIGAFYLTHLSWKLCSQAIRMATEMNLHHVNFKILRIHEDLLVHQDIRLWYVLYICDHQFATAYGRPTLMHDDAAIRNVDKFLSNGHATAGDVRLAGQMKIQQILNEAVMHFGIDPTHELNDDDYDHLRAFSVRIDQWRVDWVNKSHNMPLYGSYPSKSKVLYYHFVRFHLNALSLRGITATKIDSMTWNRREAANAAIFAAMSTLKLVIEESDIQKALVGVPIFTHSIIAMCASFLIKVVIVFGSVSNGARTILQNNLSNHGLSLTVDEALKTVEDLVDTLSRVAEKVSHRHLACDVVVGLQDLLRHFERIDGTVLYNRQHEQPNKVIESDQEAFQLAQYDYALLPNLSQTESSMANINWNFDESFMWQYNDNGITF